jgi:transposase
MHFTPIAIGSSHFFRSDYVAGALNARTGRIIHQFSATKNSSLFLWLLEKLKASYRRAEKLYLILDYCIIHKSRQTMSWLRKFGARLVLHFLPPYSPEHNVIERLWKQMHDQVTRNHRHRTMEDLIDAIEQFLRVAQTFPGTKVSLLTMAARCLRLSAGYLGQQKRHQYRGNQGVVYEVHARAGVTFQHSVP